MFEGSLVALVTPFDANGEVDYPAFDRLLDRHVEAGTDGVVVGGTTGESATLSLVEFVRLTERARERVDGRLKVVTGCGGASTAKSMQAARAVVAAGAEGCLVVTPYYNRPNQRGLEEHFLRIADAAQAPIILYNVPVRTACDLLPDTVARLATHPHIVALKEATGSLARGEQIVASCAGSLTLLSGDDASFVELMAVGAAGVISVTANVVPGDMAAICRAANDGNFERAIALNANVAPLHDALLIDTNPTVVKWVMARLGWIGDTLRLPLVPLDPQYFDEVIRACHTASLDIDADKAATQPELTTESP